MARPTFSLLGIDLGGTRVRVTRYDAATWEIQAEERRPTHADRTFAHVLEDMVQMVEKLRTADSRGIGVGVPGLVLQPEGRIVRLPNIPGAENSDLKNILASRFGLPVCIDNDANCFALAEALHGAGRGHRVVVGITMGTGVGGGIVMEGRLYRGHHGFAGEVGHMLLRPGEPPFETEDKRGDTEQFLSGTAMGKRCREAERPEEYLQGEVCALLQPSVFREVAWTCVNLTHLLDPSIIIFGGSAGRALGSHLPAIEEELRKWLLPGTPLPSLAIATLQDAGTRGAALLHGGKP